MRQRILGMMILSTILITTTFATNIDDNVNQKALATFSQKFAQAKDVHWLTTDNYIKVNFTWNEQIMRGYFSAEGELLGVARNLVVFELPINLQTEIKKNLSNSWMTELYEFASDSETVYYATIENADNKITLKSAGSSSWMVYKKVKKG